MQWYQKFFLQDIAKCHRGNVPDTKDALKAKAEEKLGIGWSYQTTETACRKSIGGGLSLAQAIAAADKLKFPVAAKSNRSAIQVLQPYFSGVPARFYPLKKEDFRFGLGPKGETLSCQIKMFGLVHYGDFANLHWNNYRLSDQTDSFFRQLVASVAQQTYLSDPDYMEFGLQVNDIAAAENGLRAHRIYSKEELIVLNDAQLAEFFDPIHKALFELISEGFQPQKTEKTKRLPKQDPAQLGFFD